MTEIGQRTRRKPCTCPTAGTCSSGWAPPDSAASPAAAAARAGRRPRRERTVVKTVKVTEEETPTATPEARELTEQYTEAFSSAASTLNWFYNVENSTDARIGLTLGSAWAVTTDTEVFPLWLDDVPT
ncbi:MAG: hypothetical protein U5J98_12090 [Halobacteriales archaeon]|nr:hypothetical protein [Halobacteriales archaeon]